MTAATKIDRRKIDLRNERRITVAEATLFLQAIHNDSSPVAVSVRNKLGEAILLETHTCDFAHSYIQMRSQFGGTEKIRSKYRTCKICGAREPHRADVTT